jgi:serine/threonine protein kinase
MRRTANPPLRCGASVADGYQVIQHLNRSNQLDVYDVWSERRSCRCIAKTLRPDRRSDRAAHGRLLQEGRLLQRLSHPHIVRGYETVSQPSPVVVMETLTGETLAHLIERRTRPLPVQDLAQLGLHLCSAIAYLHREGYLHLDLKPSNIVAESGRAKLIDLSIARPPGRTRKRAGTWCYMAPEQVRGFLSPAADVWGIAIVLYEAATGRAAYAHDADEVEYPQLEHRLLPVGRIRRLPRSLAEALEACLEPDPERRPTVEHLSRALEHALDGDSTGTEQTEV